MYNQISIKGEGRDMKIVSVALEKYSECNYPIKDIDLSPKGIRVASVVLPERRCGINEWFSKFDKI